ncbi:hypothetical protein MGG_15449 [Pyricularia oryzae 70-15]|uniref:Uncharacterized protein n=1 Tax=Pyricularia oryzae (strain 70-15 / ATCC MYA-4617 / FGSC 8958) TaxID=242507 RepID=G4NK17_PYRO7|nr:uncharacterized protein MGG_15449 [Pyricularia oryzae 70-15]EHA45785.1 hypothetical protein MGG_15449 [Pyricularia oryzae 70-15]
MCICLKGSESWAACRCFVAKTYFRPLGPQKPTFEWYKIQGEDQRGGYRCDECERMPSKLDEFYFARVVSTCTGAACAWPSCATLKLSWAFTRACATRRTVRILLPPPPPPLTRGKDNPAGYRQQPPACAVEPTLVGNFVSMATNDRQLRCLDTGPSR